MSTSRPRMSGRSRSRLLERPQSCPARPHDRSSVLARHAAQTLTVAELDRGVLPLLLILGVIYPAVWSRKKMRRTAALDVLDRILRRKG